MILKYNKIRVFAFNRSTGAPVTGDASNITATWSKDNGTPAALADTNPTEIGGGLYVFDLSVAERTVAVEGFLWPVSATSGVGVVVARAIEAEGSQDINTWVHSDVAGVTTDITSMRWWTGVAWADLFVHAGTDRPNSGGVDGPGHYHSYCALPIPPEMFVEFNGTIYPLGKRPQMAKSTTLFIDPQGTIGGLLDADIYDDLFGALATVSDASPIAGGVLALSDIASAANLAVVDGVVDTIDGKLTSARLAKIDLINPGQVFAVSQITQTGSLVDVEQFEHETTVPAFSTSVDYSATDLEIVWELESDTTEVAKLADAGLTKTSTTIAVTAIPTAVRSTVRTLKYAVRVAATEQVIVTGNWVISRAPRDRA